MMSDEIPTVYALKTKSAEPANKDNKPWGVFVTIGFSLVIFLVFIIAQTIAATLFAYIQIQGKPDATLVNELITLSSNGMGLAVSHIPGALAASLLVLLFAYTRENLGIKQYLKLNAPPFKQLLFWITIMLLFAVAMEVLTRIIDRPLPAWMIESYKTAGVFLPVFWFALVIAAPIFEELLFRGFLLEGLRHSRLGDLGAIIITSSLWAVIHLQYEAFEVISIFLVGLILGYARIKTNSLYTTIIMHALMNLAATAQVAAITNQ